MPVISFLLRISVGIGLLFLVYHFFDPFNLLQREADTLNFLFDGIYSPFIIILYTIGISALLAIPFWFVDKVRTWWRGHLLIQVTLVVAGISLLLASISGIWSTVGWLLVAFMIMVLDFGALVERMNRMLPGKRDWTK